MQTAAGVEILADLPGVPKSFIHLTFEDEFLNLQVHPHPAAPDSTSYPCTSHEPSQPVSLDDSNHYDGTWAPVGSWGSVHRLTIDNSSGEDSWDAASPRSKRQTLDHAVSASYWHPQRKIIINERRRVNRFLIRKLELPAGLDADSAEAVFAGGVLRILVPKRSAPRFVSIA